MNEILTEVFIVAMYFGCMMGMVFFLAFVCKVGDAGILLIGYLDRWLQDRHMMKLQKKSLQEEFPLAYGQPGVAKSSVVEEAA